MELQTKDRTVFGKKVGALRKIGLIPAEIFGHGLPNRHVQISEKEFGKVFKAAGENTIINAVTDSGEKLPVLISEVQRNPLTGKLIAIDLHQVRMDEQIHAKVPVEFTGISPAIKAGLVVVKVMEEIEIESLPADIPRKFEVGLESLESAGQSIHVSDVKLPNGVKILTPLTMVVVTVTEKAKEEVAPVPVTATEGTAEGTATEAAPEAAAPPTKE